MIVRSSVEADHERCSSAEWILCPAAKEHREDHPIIDRCPFLQESLTQYCCATPSPKFVPYGDASPSCCRIESHVYCELYLSTMYPEMYNAGKNPVTDCPPSTQNIFYSHNHMWIHIHDNRSCHIGIDGFLAKVLKRVETLSFVTTTGNGFPTVVLTLRGTNLRMVFPHRINQINPNSYLRMRPAHLVSYPFTLGWLFEGMEPRDTSSGMRVPLEAGLMNSGQAHEWMIRESRRLTDYVRNKITSTGSSKISNMTDGGVFSEDLITHLAPEEMHQLFNEFFQVTADPAGLLSTN